MMSKFDPRMAAYEDQTRVSAFVYIVMMVIVVAFGGFVWNLYSGETPRISAPATAYKSAPGPEAMLAPDAAEERALTQSETESPVVSPVNEAAPAQAVTAPTPLADGPYVAQLAALQTETGVEPLWARLASRAPDLFAEARLDIERADLGQRGVYYRMRAGYFADRESAGRFCARVERLGQDCIVAAR